jgi:chorismate--pyruvate lyase
MATRWLTSAWQAGAWRHWLTDRGSLTRRLQQACPDFQVVRLKQSPGRPNLDECRLLGLFPGHLAMIREVLLLNAGTPLIYAHSVIPLAGLAGPWAGLAGLGNRPLGAALFTNPRIQRQALEYQHLDRRHLLYRDALCHLAAASPITAPRTLWARRSLFSLANQPILVTEVFLPATLQLP